MSKSCILIGNDKHFSIPLNEVRSCCRAYPIKLDTNNTLKDYVHHWQQQSLLLDQGIEISDCESCWKDENRGLISFRQQLNSQQPKAKEKIHFWLSNACNQMCSYCSPKFSSTWQESVRKYGTFKNISASARKNQQIINLSSDNEEYWLHQIKDFINTCDDDSVILDLLGGEPLMQKQSMHTILSLISSKIKEINITTNLNPPDNKFLHWLLANLPHKKMHFLVSIDSSPTFNHIPRGLFDVCAFEENLKTIQNSKISLEFLSVASVLSIFDLPHFISWSNDVRVKHSFFKLNNPECLDPLLVPFEIRQHIWKEIHNSNKSVIVEELLTAPSKNDSIRLFEQLNYLTEYFNRINVDPLQIENSHFQIYWKWLTTEYS